MSSISSTTSPVHHHQRPELKKTLGSFGLFAIAFGSMIGVGWVTAVGGWLTNAGALGAMMAFGVGGTVMMLIGLCYAEATPMLPLAGGEVAYSYLAFGTFKSFLIGWCLAFGYISISGFEAISIGKVLGYMLPSMDQGLLYELAGSPVYASHLLLAVVCTSLITWMHYRGAAGAAAFQQWLIITFGVVCAVFVVAGISVGSWENVGSLIPAGGSLGSVGQGFLVVLVTVPFWFVGFDTIPQAAEEADASVEPRQLALLIVGSIAAATIFYVLIVLSVAMVVPRSVLEGAKLPAAHAFEAAFGSPLLANLVLIAAILGLLTSWNGFFLAGSRVIFALGRGRILSQWLGESHPQYGTPHNAILLTGALTLFAPLMGRDALLSIVNAGSFFIVVAFLGVALSIHRLRSSHPRLERPFKLPGGGVLPIIAVVCGAVLLVAMVFPGSPAALAWPQEIAIVLVVAAAGLGFWLAAASTRRATPESTRAYLILERFAQQEQPPIS